MYPVQPFQTVLRYISEAGHVSVCPLEQQHIICIQ